MILCGVLAVVAGSAVCASTMRVPAHYATIQQGLNASQAGDTVLVAPGEYNEFISIPSRQVVLMGEAGRDHTTIWYTVIMPSVLFRIVRPAPWLRIHD